VQQLPTAPPKSASSPIAGQRELDGEKECIFYLSYSRVNICCLLRLYCFVQASGHQHVLFETLLLNSYPNIRNIQLKMIKSFGSGMFSSNIPLVNSFQLKAPAQPRLSSLLLPARKDKYEGTAEYWVDVETTGSFEREHEETLVESTHVEGQGSDITLGLPALGVDHDAGADDSASNDDDDDCNMSSISRRSLKPTIAAESALEA